MVKLNKGRRKRTANEQHYAPNEFNFCAAEENNRNIKHITALPDDNKKWRKRSSHNNTEGDMAFHQQQGIRQGMKRTKTLLKHIIVEDPFFNPQVCHPNPHLGTSMN